MVFLSRWRLLSAIKRNDCATVEKLLNSGADPNPTESQRITWDVDRPKIPLFASLHCPTPDILQLLLQRNANPHTPMLQKFRPARAMQLKAIGASVPPKNKRATPPRYVSLIDYLLSRSFLCEQSSPQQDMYLKMYALIRTRVELSTDDEQKLMSHPHRQMYLKWEEFDRCVEQRQRITAEVHYPQTNARQRKM